MKLGKKLLKKAFTLVELVVVVAIIAILSGVSVAVYVGITDRTKTEADRANVSEWNTLLKVETVEGTLNNVIEVKDYFKDQGFGDEDFIPRTNGYGYYYCLDNNTMYLVDDSDTDTFDVTYPEDTIGEVNEGNSYRLNNTYCALNSSIDGVTFSRNALVVGQDNEVGVIADAMPSTITINTTKYTISSNKITIHPEDSSSLNATSSETVATYNIECTLRNCKKDDSNVNTIKANEEVTLSFHPDRTQNANACFSEYATCTVENATIVSWDPCVEGSYGNTATVIITGATNTVTIDIWCPTQG